MAKDHDALLPPLQREPNTGGQPTFTPINPDGAAQNPPRQPAPPTPGFLPHSDQRVTPEKK